MSKQVVIAGGGPAGTVAALAAARNGARVLLLERGECLGGVATSGALSVWGPFDDGDRLLDWDRDGRIEAGQPLTPEMQVGKRIIKGIPEEILQRLTDAGAATDYQYGFIPVNPETLKLVLEDMLLECGVEILYGTQVYDVVRAGDRIAALCIGNKRGSQQLPGEVFIDTTGDADVAEFAGVPTETGRASDGQTQGVTMVFKLGGANFAGRFYQLREEISQAEERFTEAYQRGECTHLYKVGCINKIPGMSGVVAVNTQHSYNINACDPKDMQKAILQGRRQCHEIAALMKKYLKGFEQSFLLETAQYLGIRETRRITGKYVFTREDILSAREFADSIGRNAYNLDIHLPGAPGIGDPIFLKPGSSYSIPYSVLLPQKIHNLLVAGRCISSTHEAQSSLRIMPCCMVTGQAAGTAAALCLQYGCLPGELPIKVLQAKLREQKVCL